MAEIIVTSKSDLETIIQNAILKGLQLKSNQHQETNEKFLSLEQAAQFLQLAKQTLYGFTSKRKIPFIKKGKKLYFKETDLEKWLETGRKKSREEIEKELDEKD
jgi:excisionase family DNA binding protein